MVDEGEGEGEAVDEPDGLAVEDRLGDDEGDEVVCCAAGICPSEIPGIAITTRLKTVRSPRIRRAAFFWLLEGLNLGYLPGIRGPRGSLL